MAKARYSHIAIIYNPVSTGEAGAKAQKLHLELEAKLPSISLSLHETKHAGHGETLAYEIARQYTSPLLISVSGDGGYHDVVNGALHASNKFNTQPICAVYGAGNANDHRRTLKKSSLLEAIIAGTIYKIDVLEMIAPTTGVRYAHSYIGLGLTPAVAAELNRYKLTPMREASLVARTFLRYKPFTIEVHGQKRVLDNLIFANINHMAKVLTLSHDGRPDDGRYEVIEVPHTHKSQLFKTVAKAAFGEFKDAKTRVRPYRFKVLEDLRVQLDGEVRVLKRGSNVEVRIVPQRLRTIY